MSKEKTFLEKLMAKVASKGVKLSINGPVKMAAHTLADGGQVYTEAEAPAVGDAVYADEALTQPVADGSYTLESGVTLVVDGGAIAEIVEAPAAETELMEEGEAAEVVEIVEEKIEELIEELTAEILELKKQNKSLTTKLQAATDSEKSLKAKLAAIKPASVKTEEAPKAEPVKLNRHFMPDTSKRNLTNYKIN